MNTRLIIAQAALVIGLGVAVGVADGLAGSAYDLSWNTIDGGGGTSSGGTLQLSGTIGQPDASVTTLTGGAFSLDGGFWPGAAPIDLCRADLDNDDTVEVDDLLAVINAWGTCPTPCPPRCIPDIDPSGAGDCQVNVNDLLAIINAWGPCP